MTDCNVLIVGAGPVGLTLAIDLAWRGIDVTVVETRSAGQPPEPKCNHVAARTMEIFRRLGLAEKVRDAGLPADYTFTPADHGARSFFVTLKTAGPQSLAVTDTGKPAFASVQSGVVVSPSLPTIWIVNGLSAASAGGTALTGAPSTAGTYTVQTSFAGSIDYTTGVASATFTITKAGAPIGSYYGYKLDHVAKDQAEINALNAQAAQKTGDPSAIYQAGLKQANFIFKICERLAELRAKGLDRTGISCRREFFRSGMKFLGQLTFSRAK